MEPIDTSAKPAEGEEAQEPAAASPYLSSPCKGKIALITGITGQDGSYLTELLLWLLAT